MKNRKKLMLSLVIGMLFGMLLFSGTGAKKVQAAVSYSKAVQLYNKAITVWGKKGATVRIKDDLRNNGCWTCYNETGKRVSIRPLYTGTNVRYIFKDINGDKTVEGIFCCKGYVYIFTIQSGKVKAVGAIRTADSSSIPEFRYNSKKKTFSIAGYVTARSYTAKTYKLSKASLSRVCTLANYVGSMQANGKVPYTCWVNKKKVSSATFNKYQKAYVTSGTAYNWGP